MSQGAAGRNSLTSVLRARTCTGRRHRVMHGLTAIGLVVGAWTPPTVSATAASATTVSAAGASALARSADNKPATNAPLSYRFYMEPVEYRTTLCTGESAVYSMVVYLQASTGPRDPVSGVKIEAYPNDTKLGSFDKGSQVTQGFDGLPVTAEFKFKAGKKPGKTTLVFQGAVRKVDIQTGYVSFNIPIRVVDCKFKVSGTLRFPPDESFNPIPAPPLIVRIKAKELTADTEGHLSGSATVHWVSASVTRGVPGGTCTAIETFGRDDEVLINGDVSDDGVLTLTFEFPTANGLITMGCNGIFLSGQKFPYLVNTLTVHIRTKGGVVRSPAAYKDAKAPGSAVIVVKKVKSA